MEVNNYNFNILNMILLYSSCFSTRAKILKKDLRSRETPFKDKCKRGHDESGNYMTVHGEYPMAHAMLERNHGDDVHSRVAKLKGHHSKVGLNLVEHLAQSIR